MLHYLGYLQRRLTEVHGIKSPKVTEVEKASKGEFICPKRWWFRLCHSWHVLNDLQQWTLCTLLPVPTHHNDLYHEKVFFSSAAVEPLASCPSLHTHGEQIIPSFFAAAFMYWKTVSLFPLRLLSIIAISHCLSPQPFSTILQELRCVEIKVIDISYLLSCFFWESDNGGSITSIQRRNSKYWQLSSTWKGILWLCTILLKKKNPQKTKSTLQNQLRPCF